LRGSVLDPRGSHIQIATSNFLAHEGG